MSLGRSARRTTGPLSAAADLDRAAEDAAKVAARPLEYFSPDAGPPAGVPAVLADRWLAIVAEAVQAVRDHRLLVDQVHSAVSDALRFPVSSEIAKVFGVFVEDLTGLAAKLTEDLANNAKKYAEANGERQQTVQAALEEIESTAAPEPVQLRTGNQPTPAAAVSQSVPEAGAAAPAPETVAAEQPAQAEVKATPAAGDAVGQSARVGI